MTLKDVEKVIDLYEDKLYSDEVRNWKSYHTMKDLLHCRSMLPKLRKLVEEGREGKVFRWLGFIQGVLFSHGIYTLPELKSHNRSVNAN